VLYVCLILQLDAHQNYGKRSDNRRPGSYGGGGGFGPGGPGGPGGPPGGYGRGPRRGMDSVRGIDHSMFRNSKLSGDELYHRTFSPQIGGF